MDKKFSEDCASTALIKWMQTYAHTPTVPSNPKYCLPQAQKELRRILDAGANPNMLIPESYNTNSYDDMRGYLVEAMYKHRALRMCLLIVLEYGADPYLTSKGKSIVDKAAQKVLDGTKDSTITDLHAQFVKMKINASVDASHRSHLPKKI